MEAHDAGLRQGVTELSFNGLSEGASDERARGVVASLGREIAVYPSRYPNLTQLGLENNRLVVDGYDDLMRWVGLLTNLLILNLQNSMQFPHSFPNMANSLMLTLSRLTGLTKLDLRDINLGFYGTCNVVEALTCLKQLDELQMSRTELKPEGGRVLARALPHFPLKKLTVDGNRLGSEGVREIARALTSTTITSLFLTSNHIGDAGAVALAATLPSMPNLKELWLSDNPMITMVGGQAVVDAVLSLENLVRFQMFQMQPTPIGTGVDPDLVAPLNMDWERAAGMSIPAIPNLENLGWDFMSAIRHVRRVQGQRLRYTAFAMATHPRLGEQSAAHGLEVELVAMTLHMT
jgi:Leucine-rich repeat (LRR) protein